MKNLLLTSFTLLSAVLLIAQEKPVIPGEGDISIIDKPLKQTVVQDDIVCPIASVQVLPEYPGGIIAFKEYFDKNIMKSAFDKNIPLKNYKVYISFIIEANGLITNERLLRDPGYGIGKEALRVLKENKIKWVPAKQDDKPVRVNYTYPISINIP
jgi:protein TonB